MTQEAVSVVVPVYNSAATLPELVGRLRAVLAGRGGAYEILLVNDGSRDRSWEAIEDLSARHPAVLGLDLARNFGQHNALLCGIRAARHPIIVTLDDDLQHPPEEIPALLGRLADGYDVVYGRPQEEQHGWWRDAASMATKVVMWHLMGAASRSVSAFRAFRADLRESFAEFRSPSLSIDVLLSWGTTRFSAVPVRHQARKVGRSQYSFRKLCGYALTLLTGYSTAPLRLASILGFLAFGFGLVLLAWVLVRYAIEGGSVPGFPFLASSAAIFSGTQLLVLGIMGEYLARMHHRLMDRPPYVVRRGAGREERTRRIA